MIVALVLRTGGDYNASHVLALVDGIRRHGGSRAAVAVLTDDIRGVVVTSGVDYVLPLRYGWPGWWSKMELFAPEVFPDSDLLFLDLDTVIVGDLADVLATERLTLLRDFYRPAGLQSSLMLLPAADRPRVWKEWMRDGPAYWRGRLHGDQDFLERHYKKDAARWQDALPGQVVSWKVDVVPAGGVPPVGARVVCFHGRPRPWDTPLWPTGG